MNYFLKKYPYLCALALAAAFVWPGSALALTEAAAYRAMVLVHVYAEDDLGNLVRAASLSGAIVESAGVILTDRAGALLVTGALAGRPAAYQVCVASALESAPVCEWSAVLTAADATSSQALLKIRNVAGLSTQSSFVFLRRERYTPARTGEVVRALEFSPDGELYNQSAVVADVAEAGGREWIKLSHDFRDNSAGGAVVNRDGDLVGLTSLADASYAGGNGYALYLPLSSGWVDAHLYDAPGEPVYAERMDALIRLQAELLEAPRYERVLPGIAIAKEPDWRFSHPDENRIMAANRTDGGGRIEVGWQAAPGLQAAVFNEYLIAAADAGYEYAGTTTIAGLAGKAFTATSSGSAVYRALLPAEDYVLTIDYHYGADGAGRAAVEKILNELVISEPAADLSEPEEAKEPEEPPAEEPAAPVVPEEPAAPEPAPVTREIKTALGQGLLGRILIEVELHGEAWYLDPVTAKAYFLGRPADAFRVMREQGIGITNADLNRFAPKETGKKGAGAKPSQFAARHLGKIFLQVESKGEAWYVNPTDGQRYFLGRPADAFAVMRALGLGISAADFAKL